MNNPGIEVKTDNKWKDFLYRSDVPEKVLKDDFGWCEDDDGFLKYKNSYYHLSEFLTLQLGEKALGEWDGHHGWSYFSGVLIKINGTGDKYMIANYSC